VRLLGRALSSLWISPCGRLGVIEVTDDDLDATRATEEHVQGIVNHVRGIRGVEVAVLMRARPQQVSAVFRSRGNVAIRPIAERLGGTGHKNAATLKLDHTLPHAREEVVRAVLASMPKTPGPKKRVSPIQKMPANQALRPRRRRAGPR
jgi:phosphoesterase RecJ-like protein